MKGLRHGAGNTLKKRVTVAALIAGAAYCYYQPTLPFSSLCALWPSNPWQIVSGLGATSSNPLPAGPGAEGREYQWQNPITLKQTVLGQGWIVKQLSQDKDVAASSFITDDIVVNLSIVRASNQTLTDLVNHLKTSDATLRFVNQGVFGRTGNLPNWTGIATSRDDHTKKYVVHVTSAATGYGILIGALAQQTAGSVSRLETLMAELDLTFKDN